MTINYKKEAKQMLQTNNNCNVRNQEQNGKCYPTYIPVTWQTVELLYVQSQVTLFSTTPTFGVNHGLVPLHGFTSKSQSVLFNFSLICRSTATVTHEQLVKTHRFEPKSQYFEYKWTSFERKNDDFHNHVASLITVRREKMRTSLNLSWLKLFSIK